MAVQPTKTVGTVSVTTAATALSVYNGQNFLQRTFQNLGTGAVRLGGSDVTASGVLGGVRILPGGEWTDNITKSDWFGIAESGTANVVVVEITGPINTPAAAIAALAGPSATSTDITSSVNAILAASPTITGTDAAQGLALAERGGNSSTSGNAGGAITLTGGAGGATGVGGAASLIGAAGGATSGTGGAANITGGAGTNGNADGGNVVITPGAANGSGKAGVVRNIGVVFKKQGAPATPTAAATLTIAQLLTGILSATPDATGATHAYLLPTGTNMDTSGHDLGTDEGFEWSITNLAAAAADTITITANTNHTIVGSPVVPSSHATTISDSSQKWFSRRTATNTWISYRLS